MVNKFLRQVAGAVAFAAVSVFSQAPMDSSLTAYWPFEESSLFSTNDESFNHYDLVGVQGVFTAHIIPGGPYGNYLSFDSIGCKTVARESMGKFNAPTFTFAAFVQLQGPAKLQTIFQSSAAVAGSKAGYQIQIAPDSTIRVVFGDSVHDAWNTITTSIIYYSSNRIVISSSGQTVVSNEIGKPLKLDSIAHLAVTCDGTNVRAYINGSLASANSFSNSFTPGTSSAIFGGTCIDGQYSNLFTGKIDEIRVYNRALSPAEISILARPRQQDVSGCWDIEQNGPDKVYTGNMSLTENTMTGSVNGTITWNSPYGSTTLSGTVQGNAFNITGSWASPSPISVVYSGTLSTYGEKIFNASSKDNMGGLYNFKAIKKVCVIEPPPSGTSTQCWNVRQEKSPGSNTWWTGMLQITINPDGTISGGTINWDVPSSGTVMGGSVSGNSISVSTHNITYNMDVTYTGTLSADGNSIINGKSGGMYAFDGAKAVCP
jgi:hypothetical protein